MTMHPFRRAVVVVTASLAVAAAPAAAQTPLTLTFESAATNAQGVLGVLPAQSGFAFENFGAYATTSALGSGSNASSGTRFAYGYAVGESFVYRLDGQSFGLLGAALSFRTFDGNVSPVQLVVNGYRTGFDPVFTRTLSVTNSAQLFTFDWNDVHELEFVTTAFSANRSAVLAVDDLTLSTVPEPGSVVLLATGLGAVLLVGARRRARG
jgi:hypothetical protein